MRVVTVLRLKRPLAGGEELDDGPHRTSGAFCLLDPDAFLTSDLTPGSLQKANVYADPDDLTTRTYGGPLLGCRHVTTLSSGPWSRGPAVPGPVVRSFGTAKILTKPA